jgi:acetyl esterase/lipase
MNRHRLPLHFANWLGVAALFAFGIPGRAVAAEPVRIAHDVDYYDGKDADPVRHKLDLFLPKDKRNFPVLILIHGGAWVCGDKTLFGWGPDIGRFFAGQGIGVVMPSYRLMPGVKVTDQAKDVARALAWTWRNINRYGGSAEQVFVCGHSAGGHLASLVMTDDAYLKAEKIEAPKVKGVIAVSGVYDIPEINLDLSLPQGLVDALPRLPGLMRPAQKDDNAPKAPAKEAKKEEPGVQLSLNLFGSMFGSDSRARRDASPLAHVHTGLPPFLLVYADNDLPLLPGMARQFARALKEARCEVQTLEVAQRNHESVMFVANSLEDPLARAVLKFVKDHQR